MPHENAQRKCGNIGARGDYYDVSGFRWIKKTDFLILERFHNELLEKFRPRIIKFFQVIIRFLKCVLQIYIY